MEAEEGRGDDMEVNGEVTAWSGDDKACKGDDIALRGDAIDDIAWSGDEMSGDIDGVDMDAERACIEGIGPSRLVGPLELDGDLLMS